MTPNELSAQLQFFKDIGVESLELNASPSGRGRGEAAGEGQRAPVDSLEEIRADIGDCQRCKLAPTRTHIVFGSGNPNAELVFVGEAPGYDEDQQGLPFVGRAGQLLTKIIESIGIKREDVYICNVLKCRPPDNRNPETDEVAACNPFLKRQLATIRPKQRRRVHHAPDLMHFDIARRILPQADDESLDLTPAKWNHDPAARFHRLTQLVNKGPHERQTHRNIGIHGGLGA